MNVNAAIEQEHDLFRVVLNAIRDGVTVIDKDLIIRFQNKVVEEKYGSSLIGKHCYNAYRGRKKPCEDCKILDVLRDGKERRIIRDVSLPNGEILLLELSSAAIKDTNGNIVGAVEVARDVSEQKKAEALLNKTLLKQNKVLNHLNRELSDAAGYIKTVLPQPMTSGPIFADWRFIPSVAIGGDSFGYHWIDDKHFAMYLVDVSGHGWGAALLSVSVINVLRAHALPNTDFKKPDQVLIGLNETFPGEMHNDMFFSIWYGVYCMSTRKLTYSSGGHPPALLLSRSVEDDIQLDQLRTPNFIVGGKRDITYQSEIREIRDPSRLYIFSDGVYDITKTNGSIWRIDEFVEFASKSFKLDQSNLDLVLSHAKELGQQKEFDDDFTIVEITIG